MLRCPGLFLLAIAASAQTAALPRGERRLDLESFEHVWQTVRDKHWDPKLGGLDWQAVHDELKPKVEAARSAGQARMVMSSMLERLGQTHFGIIPSNLYDDLDPESGGSHEGDPGMDVRVLEGRVVVVSVERGSPAERRGIEPGWEITRIGRVDLAPVLLRIREQLRDSTLLDLRQTRSVQSRLQGSPGEPVHLDLMNGDGHAVALDVERAQARGKLVKFGNLPPQRIWSEWRKVGTDVGYVRFNEFLDPEGVAKTVEEAVQGCGGCGGFVIDLRGNPGGIGGLAMGVAGWFTGETNLQLGTMYLRSNSLKFVIFPRPAAFRGPLAVLVDGCSASTSEIFAGGLKDIRRARIFGTRTAGAALPSVIEKLPNGDGFQYAVANYISQGGKPLEGIGVIPDEEVRLTREGLRHGQDGVLEAAMAWIHKQGK